ncbi:ABC transporter substrate-binding protein [Rhodopseudomonas palustris]|uniref:Periplasmic binding protein n=1 Tax=Rhodopseudomonas palustris (strain BisB18) TaxID=316056 RepID=Q210P0_RHOPB
MMRVRGRDAAARSIAALLLAFALALGGLIAPARADQPIEVTDVTGRSVTLAGPARKILLAEGRQIIALSLIHAAPVSVLAGWLGDFRKNDPETYALYRETFPQIDAVPVLGLGNDGTFSVEQAIAMQPDLAVLGVSFAPGGRANDVARQLEAAGIPVVFTDFFVAPFENTLRSLRILGRVTGRGAQAESYAAFYQAHMDRIAALLAHSAAPRPSILVETHAGISDCCHAPGAGNIGRFIAFAGGDSISASVSSAPSAQLGLEYVIAQNPQIYVGTGGAHLKSSGGLVIGPGFDAATIRERLAAVVARPGFAELRAVRERRVHGLFHNMLSTPLNLLVTEALAKWINPELMQEIDPDATMAEINARFLAVPMRGTYWIDLK